MTTRYASGRRQGITEELVAALSDYEAGRFSGREKAALRYADQMYVDHHKVDDRLFDELRAHFSEDEILELSWAISEFIALGKVIYVLGVPYGADACSHDGHAET
jgi:alkylhydroperoxidase family enzyme